METLMRLIFVFVGLSLSINLYRLYLELKGRRKPKLKSGPKDVKVISVRAEEDHIVTVGKKRKR